MRIASAVILGAVLVYIVPYLFPSPYSLRVWTLVCMYGTMAVGWNILGGFGNQISLGHAVFIGIGAYTCALFVTKWNLNPLLALPVGIVVSILVAVIIGTMTLRLGGHYFALATLALLEIFLVVVKALQWTGGPSGLSLPIKPSGWNSLQFSEPSMYLYIAATLLGGSLLASYAVSRSRLGLRLFGIRENPEAAVLAGVNLFRTKMIAFIISAVICSVAGTFYVILIQFVDPDSAFSLDLSIIIVIFAIVGGVTAWWGPALGALLLVPVQQYTSIQLSSEFASLGPIVYGAILIGLILFQPRGLAAWLHGVWRWAVRLRVTA